MQNDEWTVLQVFVSEAEARVVESFLKAHGFEPMLLGAHTHNYPVPPSTLAGTGLRLAVRSEDAEEALKLLSEVTGDQT